MKLFTLFMLNRGALSEMRAPEITPIRITIKSFVHRPTQRGVAVRRAFIGAHIQCAISWIVEDVVRRSARKKACVDAWRGRDKAQPVTPGPP